MDTNKIQIPILGTDETIPYSDLYPKDHRYLVTYALKQGLKCAVLKRPRKGKKDAFYLRISKGKAFRWISTHRAFFNPKPACELSCFKYLTFQIFKSAGLPIPRYRKITNLSQLEGLSTSVPSSWVVKPAARGMGEDVVVNIKTNLQLKKICQSLFKKHPSLMIEEFIKGKDLRLLILGDECLAAIRRIPPKIRGDGRHSILQLIRKINKERASRHLEEWAPPLKPIKIDLETKRTLAQRGLSLKSILSQGKEIYVRRVANLSTGATIRDVTKRVHPQIKVVAVEAVRLLGLKIAGVDIVTTDIARPLSQTKGRINEVNSVPTLWIHQYPHYGPGQPVAKRFLNWLFKTI